MNMNTTKIWPWAHSSSRADAVQVVPRKRYIQLKDTHVSKTGMIWEYSDNGGYYYVPLNDELRQDAIKGFSHREPKVAIENNPDWFEELIPVYVNKDMMKSMNQLALKGK